MSTSSAMQHARLVVRPITSATATTTKERLMASIVNARSMHMSTNTTVDRHNFSPSRRTTTTAHAYRLARCRAFSTSSATNVTMPAALDTRPISLATLRPALPTKAKRRVGRGQGSGRGGTSTRGHKGQKSRAGGGKPKAGFEGGQTPIVRLFPKRGFTNIFAKDLVHVNLGRIQERIDEGRIDPLKPITARELLESGCIRSYGDGIKVLSDGCESLSQSIHLVVSRASKRSIAAIEKTGGSVVCKYYTATTLRALVKPHKYEGRLPPRDAVPTLKKELMYYSNKANRGYLADRIPEKRRARPANVKRTTAAPILAGSDDARENDEVKDNDGKDDQNAIDDENAVDANVDTAINR